jgi:2-polyprenyl-6-methoxyphenol hydroxylase-like FAD-dependent oxidoreductase
VILIVGGGIGGLSLAACLARGGIDAEVIERHARWTTIGGGITLSPNGMRALEAVGARADVEARGLPLERIRTLGRDGRALAETPEEDWAGIGRTFVVDRRGLRRALRGAVEGVRVRLGRDTDGSRR